MVVCVIISFVLKLHGISLLFRSILSFAFSVGFRDFLIYFLSIKIHLTHFPGNDNEDKISTLSMVIILVVICKCVFISFALMAVCYRLVEGVSLRAPICCSVLCKYKNKIVYKKWTQKREINKRSTRALNIRRRCICIFGFYFEIRFHVRWQHKRLNKCDVFSWTCMCDIRQ